MASSDTRAADTPAPTSTLPDTVSSVFGPRPVAPPPVDPQKGCLIFSLAMELRDMIYDYAFTPNLQTPNEGDTLSVELGDLAATVPSIALLLTSRQVKQEAAAVFREAQRSFWKDGTTFFVDLSDDWEDEDARKERHFEVLDLLDETLLFPELSDEQVNAMENLTITVKSEISAFEIHLIGRVHQNTEHWVLDMGSSTFSICPSQTEIEWVLLEIFGTAIYYRSEPYLQSAERSALAAAHLARVPSGRRYKRSARSELQAKVAAKRAELATDPPSARSSGVKKRQLQLLLQNCWIVYRARRAT